MQKTKEIVAFISIVLIDVSKIKFIILPLAFCDTISMLIDPKKHFGPEYYYLSWGEALNWLPAGKKVNKILKN